MVYANVLEAPLHEPTLAAIHAAHQAGRTIWISQQVIREYPVTLTRPQVFENLPKATVLTHNEKDFARFGDVLVIEGIVKTDWVDVGLPLSAEPTALRTAVTGNHRAVGVYPFWVAAMTRPN